MAPKGCLLLVSGLPASGKTLLCDNLVKYYEQNSSDFFGNGSKVVFYKISIDELISLEEQANKIRLNDGYWRQRRSEWKDAIQLVIRDLFGWKSFMPVTLHPGVMSLQRAIEAKAVHSRGRDFVFLIEDNFYYKSMRYEFFQIAKKFILGFAIIMINCSLETALSRNRLRSDDNRVAEEVIIKMNERFEYPKAEGFESKTYSVCAESFDYNISEDLVHFIRDAIDNPVFEPVLSLKDKERQKRDSMSRQNIYHKMDCILRQLVNELIVESVHKEAIAKTLNESKKCLLLELKRSSDVLPQNIVNEIEVNSNELSEDTKSYLTSLLTQGMHKTS